MLVVNVTSWQRQIESNSRIVQANSQKVWDRSADLLKERVESYTPVGDPSRWKYPPHKDYTPGFLKSNWRLSKLAKSIELINDAPYAQRVENGWSSQAPSGMLRRAWMDYPQLLEQAARENKI
jgi:hypothetical protein